MSKLKAVLFDLDGTLMDSEKYYTEFWNINGAEFHPEIPELGSIIKGMTEKLILDTYFPDPVKRAEIQRRIDECDSAIPYALFDGAYEFISELRANGIKTAIVTSSTKTKMGKVIAKVPEIPLLFDRVFTGEEFPRSKPNPDCYLMAAQALGAEPCESVVFEDAFHGLKAGMSAGMFTIGICKTNSRESIQDKCSYVLDGFEGLTYNKFLQILRTGELASD